LFFSLFFGLILSYIRKIKDKNNYQSFNPTYQQQKINLYRLPPGPDHSPWHHGWVSTFSIDWVQNI